MDVDLNNLKNQRLFPLVNFWKFEYYVIKLDVSDLKLKSYDSKEKNKNKDVVDKTFQLDFVKTIGIVFI